jgi:protein-S-isoprenylcysteine O-methyltransferase Ste14
VIRATPSALLHLVAPLPWPWPRWAGLALGGPLLLAGLWLAVWSVRAAASVVLGRPDRLVRGGPYDLSRNPMYLAWTLAYLGVALLAGAAWPLLPAVALATHVAVVREERLLERRFGDAYRRYRASVRRYL